MRKLKHYIYISFGTVLLVLCGFMITQGTAFPEKQTKKTTATRSTDQQKLKTTARKKLKLKLTTVLKAKNMIGAIGDTVNLRATLKTKSKGKAIASRKLKFSVAGKYVGEGKTNSKGEAKVKYKVPKSMGSKKITVKFGGSPFYVPSSDTANFGPIKSSTILTLSQLNAGNPKFGGSTVIIRGQLYRITDKKGLDGRELKFRVNGKSSGNAATSSSGKFSYKYKIPSKFKGTLKIKGQFNGDSLYVPTGATISVYVNPPKKNAYLTWNEAAGKVGQTVTVTAILSKSKVLYHMKGYSGKKIRIYRERGVQWPHPRYDPKILGTAYTNSLGVAKIKFKIDDDAMSYSLRAHADGVQHQLKVTKVSKNKRLTVSRSPVKISVAGNAQTKIGDKIMFTVRVQRTTDNQYLKNISVRFAGGQSKKTNYLGTVIFFYTVPYSGGTGQRSLKVTSSKTKRYLAGSATHSIKVLPKTN
ncbi:MAG: hypothetical protein GY940_01110 [bacterium]|nr:hypothetical protein [bacterium]